MKIAIIGLGIMGGAMAARFLDQNADVIVHNRTPEKARPYVSRGAEWADSPGHAAELADVVITLVTDPAAVEAVVYGPEGILASLRPGAVHCDMSTVAPSWAAKVAADYQDAGKRFVQAPVLGSKPQIEQGALLVFAGGESAAIDKCRPVWEMVASRIWAVGNAEQAATTKLCCNMLIAHMFLGLGQSLVLAKKSGVEPTALLEIIQSSNLASAMYASKGKSAITRNFNANFVVDNMLKDLNLATDQGLKSRTPLPFAALAREFFVAASGQGYGAEDYSAVIKVMEAMADVALG